MKNNRIGRAIEFALKAHDGAYRKGTKIPYVTHVLEAGTIAASLTDDENVIIAAILHDTIEDTETTYEMIREAFGQDVADLVAAETQDKTLKSWQEKKMRAIEHLRDSTDIRVKQAALSDKLSNLRAINRDYSDIGEEFWNRFNQKNPAMQAWYYRSFLEALNELSDTMAYREYEVLIKNTFGDNSH